MDPILSNPGLEVHQLDVPHAFQEETFWCWAACAQMARSYITGLTGQRTAPYQGKIVQNVIGIQMNVGLRSEYVPFLYQTVRLTAGSKQTSLQPQDVRAAVSNQTPIQALIDSGSNIFHYVLVTGYTDEGTYVIQNPALERDERSSESFGQICLAHWVISL